MDLIDLVRAFLLADPAIADVVSTRIYPVGLPQKPTYPAMTIQMVSDTQHPHLRQVGPGYAKPRIQIDTWARVDSTAKTLGLAVQNRLQGFSGTFTDPTVSPDAVHRVAIEYETGFDTREADEAGGGFYWRRSMDFFVKHQGTASMT